MLARRRTKAISVLLALALAASLMPVTPGSAALSSWSQVNTPNTAGGNVLLAGSDVSVLAVAPDGLTMFAADNASAAPASTLYKSTNGGQTWTATNVFQPGSAANDNSPVVAIEFSPSYAADTTVWVATRLNVWRSINGGVTGGWVGSARGAAPPATAVITSMDLPANYFTSRRVMVGVADTAAGAGGGVFVFSESTLAWTDQRVNGVAAHTPIAGGGRDVAAVAHSPQFASDGEIIAVVTDEANTYVTTRFSIRLWAADILDATISSVVPDVATPARPPASIAFPADYDALNNNLSFVGMNTGAAGTGDVYRITGREAPFASSLATDLNVQGTGTATDISSVAFAGAAATGILFTGWADVGAVSRSANPTAATPSWTANTKGPSGASNTIVALAPDFATSNTVHAGTSGVQSAFSRSTDGGATFNARALVDTTFVTINDMALATGSTIIYLATNENAGAFGGVWKSTDGGASWERVWMRAVAGGFSLVALSPNYATDNAVFATEVGTTRIWKSPNAGTTWLGLNAQAPVTAWVIQSADSLVTAAGTGQVYRTTNSALTWSSATTAAGAGVTSLQLSPNYTSDNTMLVGGANGAVYMSTDGGVHFSRVGTAGPASAAGVVYVAFHLAYATNRNIYAASAVAGDGIFRWVVGTSTAWTNIYAAAGATMSGILASPYGALYAANSVAGAGIVRSVNPTAPVPTFEALAAGLPAGATLMGLKLLPGSIVLYSRHTAARTVLTYTEPVDPIPPTTTKAVGTPNYIDGGGNRWVTSATPFTLSANDNETGSGVAATYYRYYPLGAVPPSFTQGTSFSISGTDGQYMVEYYSVDNMGNTEAVHSQTEGLDNTPPESWVDDILPYQLAVPFDVSYAATDGSGSGLREVQLWYRYQPHSEAAWTGWARCYGVSPVAFLAPNGSGVYEFYTMAADNLGNGEDVPPEAGLSVSVVGTIPGQSVFFYDAWRGTGLWLNYEARQFQFFAPGKVYPVKFGYTSRKEGRGGYLEYSDSSMRLRGNFSLSTDSARFTFLDRRSRRAYSLYDPLGLESPY